MNKIKLVVIGLLATIAQNAYCQNPGISYYSNESTKAMRQAARAKFANQMGKQYRKATKSHYKATQKALVNSMKQHKRLQQMLVAEQQYNHALEQVEPYEVYDWHSESVKGHLRREY